MSEPRREARDYFRGVIAMAPMATGGNLPYRRLCAAYGAERTCSEMIVADKLVRGGEGPLLRHHPDEADFGVQLCGKRPEILAEGARRAVAAGARFVDLNFGCPIDLIVRRGAGAALLKRPRRLQQLVAAVRGAVSVPLSVKIRSGFSEERINAVEVGRRVEDAGADALVVHGRTRAQRYRRAADWGLIGAVAEALTIPVIGNGDILTPWDVARHRRETAVTSFLVARGALIKPWIFAEMQAGTTLEHTPPMRWAMMRRYYEFATEYFGDDARGQRRVERFFLWHLKFWHRYRHHDEADWRAAEHPLLQEREPTVRGDAEAELLASSDEEDHRRVLRRVVAGDYPGA
jgi:tRNA-dihydrouridine synthase 3